jgi:FlgD Ig-like domain
MARPHIRGPAEQLTQGRHAVQRGRNASTRRRSPLATRPKRFWWIIAIGVVSAIAGAALTIEGIPRHSILYSSSNAAGTMFGASASSPADLSQATSQFGHMPIIRVFYPGLPSPDAWTTGAAGINSSAVIVSFNAMPGAILSGADDAALSHFFDTAPTGHPIYYSYYHEPEPHIADGEFSLSDYKAAWTHIVSLANSAHNADLQSTLILTSWTVNPASGRNFRDYLPGGGIISTLGWDAYPAGTVENRDPQLTPPASFMGPEVAAAKSVGLPFGFAEFALGTANGRPGWLTEVGSYLASSGAEFGTLFNSSGFPSMKLNDGASIAAWRSVVAGSGSHVRLVPHVTPSATPPPAGLRIAGLTATPTSFTADGHGHATFRFTLTQAADVTICVLDTHGAVIRQMARPSTAAGPVKVSFYGFDAGQPVPAGRYPVLVVASNAHGSSTAEAVLTISNP